MKKYFDEKFKEWKQKVHSRIPEIVTSFYKIERVPYEKEMLLGRVIEAISNPMYSFVDVNGKLSDTDKIACQCLLEIEVETLFQFVKIHE